MSLGAEIEIEIETEIETEEYHHMRHMTHGTIRPHVYGDVTVEVKRELRVPKVQMVQMDSQELLVFQAYQDHLAIKVLKESLV